MYAPRPRNTAIDGMRGYAALIVILSHLLLPLIQPTTLAMEAGRFVLTPLTLAYNGFHAVTMFFVLSGFVLTLPFEAGSRKMASRRDAGKWYLHRARRLLPLYAASTIVLFLL